MEVSVVYLTSLLSRHSHVALPIAIRVNPTLHCSSERETSTTCLGEGERDRAISRHVTSDRRREASVVVLYASSQRSSCRIASRQETAAKESRSEAVETPGEAQRLKCEADAEQAAYPREADRGGYRRENIHINKSWCGSMPCLYSGTLPVVTGGFALLASTAAARRS